jgi:hypothetical protein
MRKVALCALALLAVLGSRAAMAQAPAPPEMVSLRFAGWNQPVRLERREASRIIFTVFVKHGFGGWIPAREGARVRGVSW